LRRIQLEPACRNALGGPLFTCLRIESHDEVVVVAQYGIAVELDREAFAKEQDSILDPLSPVLERASGHGVLATEPGPPYAPRHEVITGRMLGADEL
jgi:hypothetical protein